ncbi:hypothetical protein BJY16_007710 [Actinoplanes octamycinicus]|uniref:Secreted protein n=1 Tax=Actinoplanes octamycinicus TaxID=135948 RepID=A0A7W7H5A4_9ACTN|nr:DUF6493 family protein [Actinoplanes octamycinicus]MBB4744251.1 hypothetical protein [Actinoplanes octamycinicus]GIE56792.1 hypothetical protein Aoc01nite_21940 [Actinoplanes octamycinicus]
MSVDLTFERLVPLLQGNEFEQVATTLVEAGEPARRALAGPLQEYLRGEEPVPYPQPVYPMHDPRWTPPGMPVRIDRIELLRRHNQAATVAGAACLTGTAKLVTWLRSGWFGHRDPAFADAILRVLLAPGRPPLSAVARSLATKLRPRQAEQLWWMISRLLVAAGEPAPVTEATLTGWVWETGCTAAALRADPHTAVLLPHLFTTPRITALLEPEAAAGLAELAADSAETRAVVLAGCVFRLADGDRPGALRPVVDLHRRLAPSAAECAEHHQAYLRMLSGPHSTVVEQAIQALRTAFDAGLLDAEVVADAAWTVLPRREKKLVRAQLDWLADALGRKPDQLLFEALLTGLHSDAVDLAERTLRLAATHLPALGPPARQQLAAVADGLTGDLERQVAALLSSAEPAVDSGPGQARVPDGRGSGAATSAGERPGAAPMPERIASIPELISATVALFGKELLEPVQLELVLDGLVRFVRIDRAAVAAGLEPQVPQWYESPLAVLCRVIWTGSWPGWQPGQLWDRVTAPPPWMVAERLLELAAQMAGEPPPALLATPATVDGHVDPRRVLALLTMAEDEQWQPGRFDLSQALLRLPREPDPAVVADAERLTSPAGRTFAAWLRGGGLPDPEVVTLDTLWHSCADPGDCTCRMPYQPRRTTAFEPLHLPVPVTVTSHPGTDRPRARTAHREPHAPPEEPTAAPSGPPASAELMAFTVPRGLLAMAADEAPYRSIDYHRRAEMASWPMMLPGHPEIVAAQALPELATAADNDLHHQLALLPVLAASTGPFGRAMALCLACGLSAGRGTGRVAATDAFLELAARGKLDGAMVGQELAAVHGTGRLTVKRVAGCLTEAVRAGATTEVWAAVRELLPVVLADPGPGAPDLLVVAEAAAAATGACDTFAGLDEIAARRGRTRLVTEAARLSRTLSANRSPAGR